MRAEARRFRPGLDYTLAHVGTLREELTIDLTLCFVPAAADADATSGDAAAARKKELAAGRLWASGDVGGFECYVATDGDEETKTAKAAHPHPSPLTLTLTPHHKHKHNHKHNHNHPDPHPQPEPEPEPEPGGRGLQGGRLVGGRHLDPRDEQRAEPHAAPARHDEVRQVRERRRAGQPVGRGCRVHGTGGAALSRDWLYRL